MTAQDEVAAVDAVEAARQRLHRVGRAAMGVTGEDDTQGLIATLRAARLGFYPLIAIGIMAITDQFQGAAFGILSPEVSRALGIPRANIGYIFLLVALVTTLAALPMAALVERRPRRALIAKVAAVAWSLATLVTGFVTSVWGLVGISMLDGASTGSVQAVHLPLLTDTYPTAARARVISIYRGLAGAAGIASPLLVAYLAGPQELTWRGILLVLGVLSVAGSLVGLGLRDPGFGHQDTQRLRAEVRRDSGLGAEVADQSAFDLRFGEIVRRIMAIPTVKRSLVAQAVLGMFIVPLFAYFNFFLEERWGLDPAKRALFFAAVPALSIVTLLLLARTNERMFRSDPARLFRFAAVLQTAAIGLIAVAVIVPNFWLMAMFFAVAFASITALQPALHTGFLSIVRPQMRPHAAGMGGIFFVGVGGFIGQLVLSGMDTRYGLVPAILALCPLGATSALVLRGAAKTVGADLDRTVDELIEEEELQAMALAGTRLPMLSCRHVDFSYGQVQVLFDVDFTVDAGEMVALLGTNGAGKSTLLRVISGLGIPQRGSIRFRGGDITYLDAERRVGLGIAQVPGGHAVFGSMSVVDNLEIFGYSLGRSRADVRRGIEASFARFPRLAERRNHAAGLLSGGEQQMLGLSKALILRPRLLLIDELSLGLAPRTVSELLGMVRQINSTGDTAVVLVEQSVNVALSLVEHAYFMEKGRIRFDGKASDLLARPDLLRSVFLEGAVKGKDLAAVGQQTGVGPG